jgi:hypothetical protein
MPFIESEDLKQRKESRSFEVSVERGHDRHCNWHATLVGPTSLVNALGLEFAPAPEPSTLALAAVGFAGLTAMGWRRRRRLHVRVGRSVRVAGFERGAGNGSFRGDSPRQRLLPSNSQVSGLKNSSHESKSEVAVKLAVPSNPLLRASPRETFVGNWGRLERCDSENLAW